MKPSEIIMACFNHEDSVAKQAFDIMMEVKGQMDVEFLQAVVAQICGQALIEAQESGVTAIIVGTPI